MVTFLKNLFKRRFDIVELLNNGAMIMDVRSPSEYKSGHLKCSVNIPLDELEKRLSKLNKTKPIITCCASGMRSASAKSILKSYGFIEVHNGGAWTSLKSYDK